MIFSWPHRGTLRRFLLLWSGAIACAFVLLAIGVGMTLHRLKSVGHDELSDGERLQAANDFEEAALIANRAPRGEKWKSADAALAKLKRESWDASAMTLAPLAQSYSHLKDSFDPKAPESDESGFLDALRTFRADEIARMQTDSKEAEHIDQLANIGSVLLLVIATLGLLAGGAQVWERVLTPTLVLSATARKFGEGDLTARVPIKRSDELGELGQTFNEMAMALEAREKERLRFVAAVAHDLKNPLVVVGGAAKMMLGKPDKFSPEEHDEWLERIAHNARRMELMIFDLTDAVQAQTGALRLHIGTCDLAALGREAVEETAIAFPSHHIEYRGCESLEIQGDKARLERVLANLLSNAAKYSPARTQVELYVERHGEKAILSVHDQGAGIAAEDLQRLFTPFVRLQRTEKMASGTGLGLATVKKIVEGHGGHLEVQSEVGKGSIFRVFLSLTSPSSITPEKQAVAARR